jgi:hypothetical protein
MYGVMWGVSWLTGDRSAFVGYLQGGGYTITYPGVFGGGLRPVPSEDSEIGMLLAVTLGVAFATVGLLWLARLRSAVRRR